MDPAYLKEGALAHAKAIGNVDAKGVLPLDDLIAINSAIGHMIKSSGESSTMGTFNAFKGILPDYIPFYLLSSVNPLDAKEAYDALLQFKDVVKAR
uniref:Putative peridinin-chlorophyll a-binding protein n=1 Tax=termite gut metagenome TaxID=433724 RepID=S0DGI0_9ZZZZ